MLLAVGLAVAVAACGDDPTPSDEAFCARLTPIADLDDRLATDPASLAGDVEDLRRAGAVAPPDIADDVDVLADALDRLSSAAAAAPEDPDGAVDATLGELQGQVDQLEASSAAVADYAAATCGLKAYSLRRHELAAPIA